MDENLRKKIIEDLDKSGFGSELKAIKKFEENNLLTLASHNYFDKDERKLREIDIIGVLNLTTRYKNGKDKQFIFNNLILSSEVKKSEKPWIVFKSNYQDFRYHDFNSNLQSIDCKNINNLMIFDEIENHKILRDWHFLINGIHESFKSPNNISRWYSACMSATKSAINIFEKSFLDEESIETINTYNLIQPLVILDGMLISAEINEKNDISIEEINFAKIRIDLKTDNYNDKSCLVDIVTLNKLDDYLKMIYEKQLLINKTISKLKGFEHNKTDTWIDN